MTGEDIPQSLASSTTFHPGGKEGYYGYEPVCAADLPFQDDLFDGFSDEDDNTTPNSSLLQDKARKSKPILAFIILFATTFLLLFIWQFLVADCKVTQLCETIDSSSLLTSDYRLVTPSFRIPSALVWIGLTCGSIGFLVSTIYFFFLLQKDVGTTKMVELATIIHDGACTFLSHQYFLIIFPLALFFFLIGGLVNWSAAGAFALGSLSCIIVGHSGLSVATRGNIRTCSAAKDGLKEATRVAYRVGAIVSLFLLSMAIVSVSAGYLMFSDVRALAGFAAGSTLTTFFLRITVGLFSNGTNNTMSLVKTLDSKNRKENANRPHVTAAYVGTGIGSLFGLGPDVFDSFIGAIIATGIIGASLPFFYRDSFAMCIFNHLQIDRQCGPFGYPEALSYATYICRNENLYMQYPSLTTWASNSAFVAVPFVLGSVSLLVSLVCTSYMRPLEESNEENQDKSWKMIRHLRINLLVSCVLLIACSAAVCFGMFGPNSTFQKSTGLGSKQNLPRMELDGSDRQCKEKSVSLDDDIISNPQPIPEGARSILDQYRPILVSGNTIGASSSTALRLFGCNVLGIVIGIVMAGFSRVFFTSDAFGPTQRVAQATKFGISQTIVQGLANGLFSAIPSMIIILLSILISYRLYGSYGVGIMTIGFLSSIGHIMTAAILGSISENAHGIVKLSHVPYRVRERTSVLDLVGSSTNAAGFEFSNGASVLTAATTLLAFIEHSHLLPSLRELTGTSEEPPTRLIGSSQSISIQDISVLASLFIGAVIPFVLAGVLMIGSGRVSLSMRVSAWSERRNKDDERHKRFISYAGQTALIESILPIAFILTIPVAAAFGLGARALVGIATGVLGAGYLLGSGFAAAGSSWSSAEKIVAADENRSQFSLDAAISAAGFGKVLRDCVGPAAIVITKIGPAIGLIFVGKLPTNTDRWWIGLIIMIVTVILGIIFLLGKSRLNTQVIEEVLREDETRAQIPIRQVSPFYVDGTTIDPAGVVPGSQMADALKGIGNPHIPVDVRLLAGLSTRDQSDLTRIQNFESPKVAIPIAKEIDRDEARDKK